MKRLVSIAILLMLAPCVCAAQTSAVTQPEQAPGGYSRLVVRSGYIVLKVREYKADRAKILDVARECGATLRDECSETNYIGQNHGNITLEVSAPCLNRLMNHLQGIGKLYSQNVQTTDQTSQYESLQRKADILRQNETELLDFLHRPRRMRGSDILFVQYRLYQTRAEIAKAQQDRLDLERRSQRSLVQVSLFEPELSHTFNWQNWNAYASSRSKSVFFGVMHRGVTAAYMVLWLSPIWIPVLIAIFFLARWLRRWIIARIGEWRTRRPRTIPPAPAPGAGEFY